MCLSVVTTLLWQPPEQCPVLHYGLFLLSTSTETQLKAGIKEAFCPSAFFQLISYFRDFSQSIQACLCLQGPFLWCQAYSSCKCLPNSSTSFLSQHGPYMATLSEAVMNVSLVQAEKGMVGSSWTGMLCRFRKTAAVHTWLEDYPCNPSCIH